MTGHAQLASDVAFFLVESTLQSACLCLLVFLVTRMLAIRNPALRSNLWLMAVVYPVMAPLACHILLPRSGLQSEMKLLENTLAGPIVWKSAQSTAAGETRQDGGSAIGYGDSGYSASRSQPASA